MITNFISMVLTDIDVPEKIYERLADKKSICFNDIIQVYEDSFEYEKVGMEAGDFKNFLISELSHD